MENCKYSFVFPRQYSYFKCRNFVNLVAIPFFFLFFFVVVVASCLVGLPFGGTLLFFSDPPRLLPLIFAFLFFFPVYFLAV